MWGVFPYGLHIPDVVRIISLLGIQHDDVVEVCAGVERVKPSEAYWDVLACIAGEESIHVSKWFEACRPIDVGGDKLL